MRRAYSGAWAGLCNTHFWVDPASGVCGSIYSNFLPFGPPGAGAVRQLRARRLRVSVVSWLYLRTSTWELSRQSGLSCKFFGLICDGSSSCTRHSNRFVVAIVLSDKVFALIHRDPRLAARSAQRGAEETGTAQALPCSRSSAVIPLFFGPKM